jgi:molybdopterin/thiamine biosynthesis adenylyltransferase
MSAFSYDEAFSRNLGWVTEAEQQRLRTARVAIAGMGGVGGVHLLTLARLGVGRFSIADFDTFDIVNFNRQVGATMSTLGQPKAEVLRRMVLDINPEAEVRVFPGGLDDGCRDDFLGGADVYLDGLDFFAFDARQAVFRRCLELGIPAVTAAPLGMGAALLTFMPKRMSFDDYFGWREGMSDEEKALRFAVGLSPRAPHLAYLIDPSRVQFSQGRGPSTIIACELCAGVAAAEVLKIVLNRGKLLAAPLSRQFDAYRNSLVKTWRPFGWRNPFQAITLWVARRVLSGARDRLR